MPAPPPPLRSNVAPSPLPTQTQALHTTYPSRLRTGATLLMQPILTPNTTPGAATTTRSRRGAVINYADPGSGDDIPDAGAIESDDSDFVASGGLRSAVRATRGGGSRANAGMGVFHSGASTPVPGQQSHGAQGKAELDQSYLGAIPPARFINAKAVAPTKHEYFAEGQLAQQAQKPTSLVPIRVEFETDTHRIRDCFVWNLHEDLIKPETFARIFCTDLDLPHVPWVETVANQIRAQLEDHGDVAAMDLDVDEQHADEIPECRVILSIDVQVGNYHLIDHIEWDLLSSLTPEAFAQTLCAELGLSGEALPLIAHAVHEELVKHKKDAIEWGVIGLEREKEAEEHAADKPRDKSGLSLLKDKTGLGLGWGRAPKDGRGPKTLRSVWRDWNEAEEFATRFEVLTAEEVERREIERERASRRLRRETSKFQSSLIATRRRR
ncbi:SWI-SNF chromatin remodeling complex, Snf5 subunit [Gloeophyllum trabeum ATCC 11539]|uniref:SWI-SNF chromatin remodeling complex, Snf5 subunit n=1 Tax=Gloeophyllum trabeum (strain ATCC 11539 / FP-39264 / Madison 617) TaxID=670483 RepID=S7Q4I0_GLOTA|nr:SWI-SNF chromatin remodeling complex, Snf5 subunit [Gloeophyllum trabeum ATCC 11539]EPQ54412.1 SWI-SNF chromatin remodeling complex, Snf5 subunit [Gloeophyllum trabeum ATCC 11539]